MLAVKREKRVNWKMICSHRFINFRERATLDDRLPFLLFLFLNITFSPHLRWIKLTYEICSRFCFYLFQDKLVFQELHNSATQNKIEYTFFTLDFIPKRVLLKTSTVFIRPLRK